MTALARAASPRGLPVPAGLRSLAPVAVALPAALAAAALIVLTPPLVPLVVVAVLVAVVVVLANPLFGVLLAVAAVPLELFPLPVGEVGVTPTEGLFVLAGASWAVRCAATHRKLVVSTPLTGAFLLLLVAIVPGVAFAEEPFAAVKTLVMWAAFVSVFFLLVSDGRTLTVQRVLTALAVGGAIVGLVAISGAQDQRLLGAGNFVEGRAVGSFVSPNTLASFLALCLPGALALALRGPSGLRPVSLLSFLAITGGLALSLSRGGLLAAIGAVALMLLWRPVRAVATAVAVGLVALTAAGLASLGGNEQVAILTQRLESIGYSADNVDPRFELWPRLPEVIGDHPLVGIGLNQFELVALDYGLFDRTLGAPFSHAHNIVLNFWVELGVLGLIGILWLAGALLRVCWRACRRRTGAELGLAFAVSSALFAFALHGMVDVTLRTNVIAAVFVVLAACATVLARPPDEHDGSPADAPAPAR